MRLRNTHTSFAKSHQPQNRLGFFFIFWLNSESFAKPKPLYPRKQWAVEEKQFLIRPKSILLGIFFRHKQEKPWWIVISSQFAKMIYSTFHESINLYNCVWNSNYSPDFHLREFILCLRAPIYSYMLVYLCKLLVIVLCHLETFLMQCLFTPFTYLHMRTSAGLCVLWIFHLQGSSDCIHFYWKWNRDRFFFRKFRWSIDCWTVVEYINTPSIVCVY